MEPSPVKRHQWTNKCRIVVYPVLTKKPLSRIWVDMVGRNHTRLDYGSCNTGSTVDEHSMESELQYLEKGILVCQNLRVPKLQLAGDFCPTFLWDFMASWTWRNQWTYGHACEVRYVGNTTFKKTAYRLEGFLSKTIPPMFSVSIFFPA